MGVLDNIKTLLQQQGKKQKDLTDYLGFQKNTFTNWNAGKNTSYNKYLPQIADFFGVSVERLIGAENKNEDGRRKAILDYLHSLSDDELEKLHEIAMIMQSKK